MNTRNVFLKDLIDASKLGDNGLVKQLLAHGVNIEGTDKKGYDYLSHRVIDRFPRKVN